jgi:hypothetical protein
MGMPHRGYREFLNVLQEESLKFRARCCRAWRYPYQPHRPAAARQGWADEFQFTRVETHGYPQMGWTLGVIDTDLPTLFRFETHAWPAKNP